MMWSDGQFVSHGASICSVNFTFDKNTEATFFMRGGTRNGVAKVLSDVDGCEMTAEGEKRSGLQGPFFTFYIDFSN